MSVCLKRVSETFFAICLLAWPAQAADEPIVKVGSIEGVTEYKLANGFRVLLIPDNSKPIVTVNNTVFVGSRHEGYGETGMAHLLEHMCIKSTPTFPNIMRAIREHGGSEFNAFTRKDVTNFFEVLPASDANLEFGIKLEADRLLNCDLKREDLITEMTVVRSEFEQNENSPVTTLGQRLVSAAYEWHNYGKTVLGNRSDIERYPIESLQAFYKKHYRIDNAMLIVAGKFEEKKALEFVAKYFGPLKKPNIPLPVTYTAEPPQDGERQVALRRVGTVGAVGVMYHIPAASQKDFAAVSVLTRCLSIQPEGRLQKTLVKNKKASSAGGTAVAQHDPGCAIFEAHVENLAALESVRETLVSMLENIPAQPISEEEVARVKKESRIAFENSLHSTKNFALELSEWAGLADWRLFFIQRDRVQEVTAADVNRVAGAYFKRENRTVGIFYPSDKAVRVAIPEKPAVAKLIEGYKGREALAATEVFEATPENIEKRVTRGRLGAIQTAYLPRKSRGDTVEFALILRFGNADSLKGKDIACDWLGSMLLYGTKKHNRQQLQDLWNKLEGDIYIGSGVGTLTVYCKAKKENLADSLKSIVELLREPAFPEADFEELKRKQIASTAASKTEPDSLAILTLQKALFPYPKGHIRCRLDFEESIAQSEATTIGDIKTLYSEQLSAAAGELAVAGDFDSALFENILGTGLKGWTSKIPYERIPDVGTPAAKGQTIVIATPDKSNSVYRAGAVYPMTDSDPDYAALRVGNHLLGERADNRLFNRVRVEKGLSYDIGTSLRVEPLDKSASLVIKAIANPENMSKVEKLIAEELNKFLKEGVTPEEVAAAKKELLQDMRIVFSDNSNLVGVLQDGLNVGRTMKYYAELQKRVEAVTPEDVKRAFNKVLDPKKLIIVEAGDFKK